MRDLVLIPGWGFDARVWRPVADLLAADFRIHDNAGLPPAGAIVCGWSLGAFQALRWAAQYPDRVDRLVLVGATPRFLQAPDWPAAQPAELLAGFAAAVAEDASAALRRFAALINQGDDQGRALTRQLHALLNSRMPDAATLADGLAQLRDADLRATLADIRQPTLVLHGERDPLMPLAAGRWLAEQLPQGRLEIFTGAAHAPFLAQPERFAALLTRFADE